MSETDVAIPTDNPWSNSDANAGLEALRNVAAESTLSFADLAGDAAVVAGRALTDKMELVGRPHIITSVAFRHDSKGGPTARDFVSVECVDINNLAIVYNDSSTGVRRQIVKYLQGHGQIEAAMDPDARMCEVGNNASDITFVFVTPETPEGVAPALGVPHGLRRSDFTTDEYGEATTYYLS